MNKRLVPRPLLVITILLLVSAAWWVVARLGLDLTALQNAMSSLQTWYQAAPAVVVLAYVLLYVVAAALSVPGALLLTLAGGAMFGLGWGVLWVSLASTAGATLAMLVSRHVLRDWVQSRWSSRMRDLQQRLQQDGSWVLLSLRLVPVVPFFLINVAAGLTQLRVGTFWWVSQLGMLPATLVYVNAGTQLASIRSLSDAASPTVWGALVLLAVLPWLARPLVKLLQHRRALAPWRAQRPSRFDRNLVVIGGGAAGLVASYVAAAVRAKVTLVEASALGGDCLYHGCVPSKALIRCAAWAHHMRQANVHGVSAQAVTVDFAAVMRRVREVIAAIEPHDSPARYTALGVEVVQGRAVLESPWHVCITLPDGSEQRLSTRAVVLATGASPIIPPVPGIQGAPCVTSDTLWQHLASLNHAPARLIMVGGGPMGCELAQAMARLGSQVTLVERGQRLLSNEDPEVGAAVAEALQADGVLLRLQHGLQAVQTTERGHVAVITHGEQRHDVPFDLLVFAVGRLPKTQGFGLEALGVQGPRVVQSNEYLQTLCPTVFVAGDATGRQPFTHAAAHQAWHATVNALFGWAWRVRLDNQAMPAVTFTDPEVGRVGFNEAEARAHAVSYEVTRYNLAELDRAITDGQTQGWIKVLTAPGKDTLLGVTWVGAHAGEGLAEFALAMRHRLGLGAVLRTLHPYPTWSEAAKATAGRWRQDHAPQYLLRWLERLHRWRRG